MKEIELKELLKEAFEAGRDYQYTINPYSGKPSFTKWYNAKLKLLGIANVVGRSEQLVCPECKSTDCKTAIHTDYKECNKCYHYWEAN